uniref:Uncharacterized protein n=1 Tax=Macaca fascicularis TaxID=9541 RepID=A0A7N9CHE0_MACFA
KGKYLLSDYRHENACICCNSHRRKVREVKAARPSVVAHTCNPSSHFGRLRWEDCLSL